MAQFIKIVSEYGDHMINLDEIREINPEKTGTRIYMKTGPSRMVYNLEEPYATFIGRVQDIKSVRE